MKLLKVICALFIFGFVSVSHAAVIFFTEKDGNGNVTSLLGADNVDVNGSFYNVRFQDGTCIALFNGCDDATDFVFNTPDTATAASEALLAQVFVNGIMGDFDSIPWLANGCIDDEYCIVATPYQREGQGAFSSEVAVNVDSVLGDAVLRRVWDVDGDFAIYSNATFAVWVEASAPGTAMILLMGIAGLLVSQRRK
jgi:hypothetical protein